MAVVLTMAYMMEANFPVYKSHIIGNEISYLMVCILSGFGLQYGSFFVIHVALPPSRTMYWIEEQDTIKTARMDGTHMSTFKMYKNKIIGFITSLTVDPERK